MSLNSRYPSTMHSSLPSAKIKYMEQWLIKAKNELSGVV